MKKILIIILILYSISLFSVYRDYLLLNLTDPADKSIAVYDSATRRWLDSTSLTLVDVTLSGDLTLSGGTANQVLYLNGSKVVSGIAGFTFDGTDGAYPGALDVVGAFTAGSIASDAGVSGVDITASGTIYTDNIAEATTDAGITLGSTMKVGNLTGTADTYQTLIDMSVSATPADGDPMGFAVKVDGNTVGGFYAEADHAGGVDNFRIIGSTTKLITVADSVYTLDEDYNWDEVILHVTYTDTGACTITIDTDMLSWNTKIIVKDADLNASGNTLTIATEGAETIDESATATITGDGDSISLYTDGTNWFIY